jgi:hypothetical protein
LDLTRFGGFISSLKIKAPITFPQEAKVIVDILYETGG